MLNKALIRGDIHIQILYIDSLRVRTGFFCSSIAMSPIYFYGLTIPLKANTGQK